ncbi:hypothetical protein GC089_03465 [Cellulomonas sp. JZ18]|uniref:hypothetical protein n=1 Tax=Cellulomonas sp. JZ18 TaxID=2654191 RepID=UPI0012D3E2FD|nr:hypothetical protein [Cellulomonas sp. JZ18]QGQ18484.1 hypothetical protein GC089_03465 [Cellulomonas sp. JZ18]
MDPTTGAGRSRVRRQLVHVGVAVLLAGGAVVAVGAATADDPTAVSSTDAAEPDLVRAVATNGREGYVHRSDLEPADLTPANPTEAVALQRAADEVATAAFVDTLAARLGVTIDVPVSDAVTAMQTAADQRRAGAGTVAGTAAGRRLFTALGLDANVLADRGDDATAEAVDAALDAAERANQRELPVYESDGRTRIGTFVVG